MTHITIEKEKLESVLEALEANQPINYCLNNNGERFPMMQEDPFRFEANTKAITAIKEALAQPEQREPTKQEHNILMGALKRSGKVVAQPEQEPVAELLKQSRANFEHNFGKSGQGWADWIYGDIAELLSEHASPPQRTWVGLTIEDKKEYIAQDFGGSRTDAMDWTDKRLMKKNT